jgi:hypothetical protein
MPTKAKTPDELAEWMSLRLEQSQREMLLFMVREGLAPEKAYEAIYGEKATS